MTDAAWSSQVKWSADGLVVAVAQDFQTRKVLMLAWMSPESLRLSIEEGRAVYWSRSRQRLWRKGEESGHVQRLHEVRLDCDGDSVLLLVEQLGGIACHTGRETCFYSRLIDDRFVAVDPVLKSAQDIYGKDGEKPDLGVK